MLEDSGASVNEAQLYLWANNNAIFVSFRQTRAAVSLLAQGVFVCSVVLPCDGRSVAVAQGESHTTRRQGQRRLARDRGHLPGASENLYGARYPGGSGDVSAPDPKGREDEGTGGAASGTARSRVRASPLFRAFSHTSQRGCAHRGIGYLVERWQAEMPEGESGWDFETKWEDVLSLGE